MRSRGGMRLSGRLREGVRRRVEVRRRLGNEGGGGGGKMGGCVVDGLGEGERCGGFVGDEGCRAWVSRSA